MGAREYAIYRTLAARADWTEADEEDYVQCQAELGVAYDLRELHRETLWAQREKAVLEQFGWHEISRHFRRGTEQEATHGNHDG